MSRKKELAGEPRPKKPKGWYGKAEKAKRREAWLAKAPQRELNRLHRRLAAKRKRRRVTMVEGLTAAATKTVTRIGARTKPNAGVAPKTRAEKRAAKAAARAMQEPMTDTVKIDNPAEYAERRVTPKIAATRSLRDDPIGNMHSRGHLGRMNPEESDEARARLAQARLFQSTWEASGRGMIRSPEFDGGPGGSDPSRRSGTTDRRLAAGRQLAQWRVKLGEGGFQLLEMILIDKSTVAEAARRRHGMATKANVTYVGHRLRECLDAL